ncbi:PQ loop repeat protein [Necator americanus]|uniref:PQ loop repeat protein n=1 Tax=Necator americanus TaxID=51031 RepID=W2SNW7_NECAM|nr:PQ loop repeat protein [Necator americanus]ETN70566.1 PQ loop repeat protein [Necator americanus]
MKNGGLVIHDLTADDYNCTNGIQWIERIFSDCVDTELKLLGFIIGIISLLLWLVPLLPQLLQNYRTKKCEGLSLTFLFLWLVGDTCNMLGAMLTHQTPIQQIIGVYYIFQDLALWGQYGYYTKVYPKLGSQRSELNYSRAVYCIIFTWFILSIFQQFTNVSCCPFDFSQYYDLGYIIGSVAALCYFGGRIPQIIKNYQRKSCAGLSLLMFYIIVAGNLTYGVSVLLGTTGWLCFLRHLPWLAGSLGCVMFDIVVISQYYYYSKKKRESAEIERERLLENSDHDD